MKITQTCIAMTALCLSACYANAAVSIDIQQYPTPEFVNPATPLSNYRWWNQDWGWTHGAIGGTITTAELLIGAYDVDWSAGTSGEHDLIYAWKGGVKTLLGELDGSNNQWDYTTFTLDSSWFADIAAGLQVWVDIDSTHTSDTWAVSISKSVLTIDGAAPPPPEPTAVPEPATVAAGLLLLVPLGVQGLRRLRAKQ